MEMANFDNKKNRYEGHSNKCVIKGKGDNPPIIRSKSNNIITTKPTRETPFHYLALTITNQSLVFNVSQDQKFQT